MTVFAVSQNNEINVQGCGTTDANVASEVNITNMAACSALRDSSGNPLYSGICGPVGELCRNGEGAISAPTENNLSSMEKNKQTGISERLIQWNAST